MTRRWISPFVIASLVCAPWGLARAEAPQGGAASRCWSLGSKPKRLSSLPETLLHRALRGTGPGGVAYALSFDLSWEDLRHSDDALHLEVECLGAERGFACVDDGPAVLWVDGQPEILARTSDRVHRLPVEVARRLFAASSAELVVSGVRFRFAPETLVGLSRIAHSVPPPAGVCRD